MNVKRDFNSLMTIEDLTIFSTMLPLAYARYQIQDKIDAAAILEWIDADALNRNRYIDSVSYAAANYYIPEY